MYIEISKNALDLVNNANLTEFDYIYEHKANKDNCIFKDMSETAIKNYINTLEYLVEQYHFKEIIVYEKGDFINEYSKKVDECTK